MSEAEGSDSWGDDWDDEQPQVFRSLFDAREFESADACFDHDAEAHGFDLRVYKKRHALDEIGVIKCVNFIRAGVRDGVDVLRGLESGPAAFACDDFMLPVLKDDAVLCYCDINEARDAEATAGNDDSLPAELVNDLRAQNKALLEALSELRLQAVLRPQILQEDAAGGGSDGARQGTTVQVSPGAGRQAPVDEAYFDSYSFLDIHRQMLEDRQRTGAYQCAPPKTVSA